MYKKLKKYQPFILFGLIFGDTCPHSNGYPHTRIVVSFRMGCRRSAGCRQPINARESIGSGEFD